jgi:hypothetical protein
MSLMSRLERRLGRWAIPNLTLLLIAGQAMLYVAALLPQGVNLNRLTLDPARVLQGEVWRLGTFMLIPPPMPVIFAMFYFLLLNMFGTTLEQQWGTFRYNMFLLVGCIANIIAAFVASAWLGGVAQAANMIPEGAPAFASFAAPNEFLYSSIFLAFARLYPDYILNLFFILPIRIRWLALLMWLTYGYMFVRSAWPVRLMVVATVLNYLLFFGKEHWRDFKSGQRRRSFRASAAGATAAPKHVCRVCGLSSDDSPKTLFRYCSKCAGQACYCPDHIRGHEHVTAEQPAAP